MTKKRMREDMGESLIRHKKRRLNNINLLKKQIEYSEYNERVKKIGKLRKEILNEILCSLIENYKPGMKIIPCKEHLLEKSLNIEKTLFKKAKLNIYTDPEVIKLITGSLCDIH